MNSIPMTKAGSLQLQEELKELKTVARPKVIAAIAEARAHGDLKENAEYHAAKEQQGFIEARIRDIEAKLAMAQIVDVTKMENNGKVVFGATVGLTEPDSGQQVTYKIVGEDEANIKTGKISISSPISRALIGKYEGDIADVVTPSGLKSYEIDSVSYI